MDKQDLLPLKGFRDFLPQAQRLRSHVIDTIKSSFELSGFEPIETPALERQSLLLGKYGDEADKLVYRFEDEGKRKVGLRYDQTVPTARLIASLKENLGLPFKRYQIQPVWRAEKPQKGRYREFLQCDIDIYGSKSLVADADVVATALSALNKLGIPDLYIEFNSRVLLYSTLDLHTSDKKLQARIITSLDKLDKLPISEIKKEMATYLSDKKQIDSIIDSFNSTQESAEIQEFKNHCLNLGIDKNSLVFNPTIARGLDYYTGMIFEIKSRKYQNGSIAGGGRYDNLIKKLSGTDIPSVGIALGFDRIIDVITDLKLELLKSNSLSACILNIDPQLTASVLKLAHQLRSQSISVNIYPDSTTKIDKQIKYADKKGARYVLIIGEKESKSDMVSIKDLKTGKQKTVPLSNVSKSLVN